MPWPIVTLTSANYASHLHGQNEADSAATYDKKGNGDNVISWPVLLVLS